MVLADTGCWLSLASSKDRHHTRALEVSFTLSENPITTWPVMNETCYLLSVAKSDWDSCAVTFHSLYSDKRYSDI